MADPFASQRPQYQQQLQQLMTDPNSFKQDPGYQFALGQGQEAISGASNALYGGTRAGSLYPELAKYTEGYASQSYDNRIQQLMQMAGVQSGSPGTAGALNAGGYQNQSSDLGGGLSNLGRALWPQAGNGLGALINRLINPSSGGRDRVGSVPTGLRDAHYDPNDPTSYGDPGGGNQNYDPYMPSGGYGNDGMGSTWDSGNSFDDLGGFFDP